MSRRRSFPDRVNRYQVEFSRKRLAGIVRVVLYAAPVVLTFHDCCATFSIVCGASMQVPRGDATKLPAHLSVHIAVCLL